MVRDAGFSLEQIDTTTRLLSVRERGQLIVSTQPPTTMDQLTSDAQKIVSTLFQNRKLVARVWKGLLPKPTEWPSLTFGHCSVIDREVAFGLIGVRHRSWISKMFQIQTQRLF